MRRRIATVTPGRLARFHTGLIWSIATAARPFRYRGVQRLSWELTRFFPQDNLVCLQLSADTKLLVPLGDGYWTKLLNKHYRYEAEVAALLERHLDEDTYFFDCGANIGYWSLLSREVVAGVVAVEANPVTLQRLQDNVDLNGADITLVNAALWNRDDEELMLVEQPRQHAGASVAQDTSSALAGVSQYPVTTVTLRTLIEKNCPNGAAKIVIKLDVEGAEIQAIEGAGDLLRTRRVILVYEDHGGDATCKVSRFLQAQGFVTADPVTEQPLSVGEIAARKTQTWKGYNFLAYYDK